MICDLQFQIDLFFSYSVLKIEEYGAFSVQIAKNFINQN